jgi:hypothetical protein
MQVTVITMSFVILMVCQFKPSLNSFGLDNVLCIRFTLLQSRIKSLGRFKEGISRSKMERAGFHSTANSRPLIPLFATTIITPCQTAFLITVDCQSSALRPNTNHAKSSGLWPSALKFRLLTLAISSTTNFNVTIRTANCQHRVKNLSAEFSNGVKSCHCYFTLKALHILDARLYKCKTQCCGAGGWEFKNETNCNSFNSFRSYV